MKARMPLAAASGPGKPSGDTHNNYHSLHPIGNQALTSQRFGANLSLQPLYTDLKEQIQEQKMKSQGRWKGIFVIVCLLTMWGFSTAQADIAEPPPSSTEKTSSDTNTKVPDKTSTADTSTAADKKATGGCGCSAGMGSPWNALLCGLLLLLGLGLTRFLHQSPERDK